jgi:hypothetical protein
LSARAPQRAVDDDDDEGPPAEQVVLRLVPFGVGQFLNGDEALGAYFFAAETGLFLGSLYGFVAGQREIQRGPCTQVGLNCADAIHRFGVYRALNWVAFGGGMVNAVIGVVEGLISIPHEPDDDAPRRVVVTPHATMGPGELSLGVSVAF